MTEAKNDLTCVLKETAARVGDADTGTMSFEDRHSNLVFQLAYAAAHGRLRYAEGNGRAAKTQIFRHEERLSEGYQLESR